VQNPTCAAHRKCGKQSNSAPALSTSWHWLDDYQFRWMRVSSNKFFTRYHFGLSDHLNPLPALICKNHRCPPKLSLHRLSICAVGITIDPLRCHHCFFNYESLTQLRRCIWNFILARVQHIPSRIRNFLRADLVTDAATSLPSLGRTYPVQWINTNNQQAFTAAQVTVDPLS